MCNPDNRKKLNEKKNNQTNKSVKESITLTQKLLILCIFSIIINHLTDDTNFPTSDNYQFPWLNVVTTFLISIIILIITELNFRWFKKNTFSKKLNIRTINCFFLSCLGFIIALYLPIYYIINWLLDEEFEGYDLFVGLSITLLLSTIIIIILYAKDIYNLHKFEIISGKLIIQKGSKKILIAYTNISYFYSENKIVYVVKLDGSTIATDFTLSEIEDKMSKHLFFRANRQTFIHLRSISKIETIENGKLAILLQPNISKNNDQEIVISRYKKQAFLNWFEQKL